MSAARAGAASASMASSIGSRRRIIAAFLWAAAPGWQAAERGAMRRRRGGRGKSAETAIRAPPRPPSRPRRIIAFPLTLMLLAILIFLAVAMLAGTLLHRFPAH